MIRQLGKKKNHTPPCSSAELFFAEKNGVHRGKISVVDMVFLVFIGFCIHHRPGKFFFAARKVLQKIFFRWWLCTLFSSLDKGPSCYTNKARRVHTYFTNTKKGRPNTWLSKWQGSSKTEKRKHSLRIYPHPMVWPLPRPWSQTMV